MSDIKFYVGGVKEVKLSPAPPIKVEYEIRSPQHIGLTLSCNEIEEAQPDVESFYIVGDTLYIVGGVVLAVDGDTLEVKKGDKTLSVLNGTVVYGG